MIFWRLKLSGNHYPHIFQPPGNDIRNCNTQLGTSLFQFAQSLFALEQTLISRAKERFNKMSEELQASCQNPILSGPLMSDFEKKEWTKSRSKLKYETVRIDTGTKCLPTKRLRTKHLRTKCLWTKHPRTKHLWTKRSTGQNIYRTKCLTRQNVSGT